MSEQPTRRRQILDLLAAALTRAREADHDDLIAAIERAIFVTEEAVLEEDDEEGDAR